MTSLRKSIGERIPKTLETASLVLEQTAPVSKTQRNVERTVKPPFVSRLAMLYYCISFGGFTWIWIGVIRLCLRFPLVVVPLVFLYLAYITGPGSQASCDGSWRPTLRTWRMWRTCKSYFARAELIKTADLDASRPYIFVHHPHGILAFSAWLAFGTEALGFSTLFPGIDNRVVTLNINFHAPFLREYLLAHGVCSVAKSSLIKLLNLGKSVTLVVGGGSESLLSSPGKYELVLDRRKGFVKVALETGASLVPVIGFGETETYRTVNQFAHDNIIRKMQRKIEKRLGFTLPIVLGRGVLFSFGLLPYPVPLHIVTGPPVHVPEFEGDVTSAAFRAQVDKYHGIYKKALFDLFESNKEKYAKDAADMVIIE